MTNKEAISYLDANTYLLTESELADLAHILRQRWFIPAIYEPEQIAEYLKDNREININVEEIDELIGEINYRWNTDICSDLEGMEDMIEYLTSEG